MSSEERSDANLRRHEPDQAPGERFLERLAREVLFLRRVRGHDPARVVDAAGSTVRSWDARRSALGASYGCGLTGAVLAVRFHRCGAAQLRSEVQLSPEERHG